MSFRRTRTGYSLVLPRVPTSSKMPSCGRQRALSLTDNVPATRLLARRAVAPTATFALPGRRSGQIDAMPDSTRDRLGFNSSLPRPRQLDCILHPHHFDVTPARRSFLARSSQLLLRCVQLLGHRRGSQILVFSSVRSHPRHSEVAGRRRGTSLVFALRRDHTPFRHCRSAASPLPLFGVG